MQTGSDITYLAIEDLIDLIRRILVGEGVSEENAGILAANCTACERDGTKSHGIFRVPGYVSTLRSGWVDGRAVPAVELSGPSFLRVDAKNGFAQPALAAATPRALAMARESGAAVIAIRNSHHFSALWPDIEIFAEQGLVCLSMVAGLACVAPPGGRQPVFGTNPFAFGTPVADAPPMIFDFATSAMSNGDLRLAARAGRKVADGTGIDREGAASSDPAAILGGGALLPFGGHKGAAMALMVEICAAALTGGSFSYEVDFSGHPGAETPRTGQMLLVIDPGRGGNPGFVQRVAHLISLIKSEDGIRLPSEHRYKARKLAIERGIPIAGQDYEKLLCLLSKD